MESLGVPDGYEIAAVIPFGFPKESPWAAEGENLDERLRVDGWNGAGGSRIETTAGCSS